MSPTLRSWVSRGAHHKLPLKAVRHLPVTALSQRTHSQRARGVMSFQISRTVLGAPARTRVKSVGTSGSCQPRLTSTVTSTLWDRGLAESRAS